MPTLRTRWRVLALLGIIGLPVAASGAATEADVFAGEPLGTPHVYKTVGGRALQLHVVKPEGWQPADRRPAIVFFHGGAWRTGKPVQFNEHARYLATRGMVCAQVEYRLLDAGTSGPPLACVQDARSAMRWMRAHAAELGVDPARIAAGGGSAGGHLAAFVGMVEGLDGPDDDLAISPKADALVLFNPVFDNGPEDGYGAERIGARYPEFSPAHNVTRDDPPAIVFLGSADRLVPVRVLERFQAAMARAGVRCDAIVYPGQPHGFFNFNRSSPEYYLQTLTAADAFLTSLGWLQGAPTLERIRPVGVKVIRLFNGHDFSGLHIFSQSPAADPAASWRIEGGMLRCLGAGRGYVRTVQAFADYRLRLEWRWPAGRGNSGIMLNLVNDDIIWPKCIEAQLATDRAGDFATFSDARSRDEIVARNPRGVGTGKLNRPGPSVEKPLGEWNTYEAVVSGDVITLIVNGTPVNRMTGVTPTAGMIGLQCEGSPIDFRNITLELLPPAKDLNAPQPP